MAAAAVVQPRQFQVDLVEFAKHQNTIIYLETGSGKTHIAFMLLKEKLHQIIGSFKAGAKRSVFLANTVHLVEQQKDYLKKFLPPEIKVESYIGSRGVDYWSEDTWNKELEYSHVLVMSPQILVDAMQRGMVSPSRLNVIIFDECHRAVSEHPYREVMRRVFEATRSEDSPLILGLTASILNDKGATLAQNAKTLEELEKTFRAAVVGPREALDSLKYKTSAKEYVVTCENISGQFDNPLVKMLQAAVESADKASAEHRAAKKQLKYVDMEGIPLVSDGNVAKDFKKLFADWLQSYLHLGLMAGVFYGEAFVDECRRIRKEIARAPPVVAEWEKQGKAIAEKMQVALAALGDEYDQITNGLTEKVHRLIELLTAFSPKPFPDDMSLLDRIRFAEMEEEKMRHLRGIIFVQQRTTTDVLVRLLQKYGEVIGELGFVKVGRVFGHNAPKSIFRQNGVDRESVLKLQTKEYDQWVSESRQQLRTLERFRMGELNLLVATDVLEEGIDVPACNLIVRFDRSSTFRSYVQSRGRARARNANFVFFASVGDRHEIVSDLDRWHQSEQELIDVCEGRMVPTEEDVEESFNDRTLKTFAPYGPSGPVITPSSAIPLVSRYVARYGSAYQPFFTMRSYVIDPTLGQMPVRTRGGWNGPLFSHRPNEPRNVCSSSSRDNPHEAYENHVSTGCEAFLSDLPPTLYKVFLYFPSATAIAKTDRVFQSELRSTVKEAKRDACLKAVKKLWEMDELDSEHLLPKKLDLDIDQDDEDDYDSDTEDPGDMDWRNLLVWPYTLSRTLKNTRPKPGKSLFVYKLEITSERVREDFSITSAWKPETAKYGVGLLSRKRLPDLAPFELHPKQGTAVCSLKLIGEGAVAEEDQIMFLERFYSDVIVRHVLEISDPLIDFDSRRSVDGPLFVPIDNEENDVAWAFVCDAVSKIKTWRTTPPRVSKMELFKDGVVVSDYAKIQKYHIVIDIDREKTARSSFTKGEVDVTYADYVQKQYNRVVQAPDAPLLKVTFMTRLLFMLKSRFAEEDSANEHFREMHLVPELCRLSPVPASLWLQLLLIPSAYHRMNCIFKAAELRQDIRIGPDDPRVAPVKPKLLDVAVCAMSPASRKLLEKLPRPPVSEIYEAVTAKGVNEMVDYERYETLGDAVLKLIASLDLFLRYPDAAEGPLTSAKGKIISNGALERMNKKKKISDYWNVAMLQPRETWLPPLFHQPEFVDKFFLDSGIARNHWDVTPLRTLVAKHGFDALTREAVISAVSSAKAAAEINRGAGVARGPSHLHYLQNFFMLKKKAVADVAESLAGVHLAWNGLGGAWKFFSEWLGIQLLDWDELVGKIGSPVICDTNDEARAAIIKRVEAVQGRMNYTFREPMYLVQALTHPSYVTGNIWTRAYERLEFLGDAVLDYLVTVNIFEDPRIDTPEKISDLRSALTNNETLACICVEHYLHTDLLVTEDKTVGPARRFADYVFGQKERNGGKIDWKGLLLIVPDGDGEGVEHACAPKCLADVVEALVGAVFLDSGLDLTVVWRVFEPWLRDAIDQYSSDIPVNPVKAVSSQRFRAQFINHGKTEDGRTKFVCEVTVDGKRRVRCVGVAENNKRAKMAAARDAWRQCQMYNLA